MEKVERKKAYKKTLFLEALVKSYGNISQSCNSSGVSSASFYKWKDQDPTFAEQARQAIEEGQQLRLDRAEFVQAKLLDSKDEGMRLKTSMYILNNKGKKRGYNNEVEQTPPPPSHDYSRLTDEELHLLRKITAKLEGKE